MKLDNPQSIFNMGDTSIRVKQLVEVNKLILMHVQKYKNGNFTWERNSELQEDFYKSFIDEIVRLEEDDGIELFNDFKRAKNYSISNGRVGLRGRTLTNALVKTGLISQSRKISSIGRAYLNHNLEESDEIERLLGLSEDNLIYLRQFLKLRIYSSDSDNFFYNFRFALKFLSKYKNIPQQDFFKILESIKPEQTEQELHYIINEYSQTYKNQEIFEEYYKRTFAQNLRHKSELKQVKEMFRTNELTDENFIKFFNNRDSNQTSLLYKKFVLLLLEFFKKPSDELLSRLTTLSKDSKIKKAFGEGKIPFSFSRHMTTTEFLEANKSNPLLSGDGYQIYLQFIFSKHNDLIKEYSDMCRRAFQVTGLINFENGLANLNNSWVISPLLELLGNRFILSGNEKFEDYELNDKSVWFSNTSTKDILNITNDDILLLYKKLGDKFNTENLSSIADLIDKKREQEYRSFIKTYFPIDKVIRILELIKTRNDEKVFELVTDNATVPTIYEYILTIAWYYISKNKNFFIHKIFQVSLDGNKLPLTHRGGGAGDIEVINDEYALLIEATLMNMNTQKRGELEPVIRHSINFSLRTTNPQTIFIANELDNNVLNVFRATQFIQFNGTLNSGIVNGLNIFALTTDEIITILQKGISDSDLLKTISPDNSVNSSFIKNGWRENIISKLLN